MCGIAGMIGPGASQKTVAGMVRAMAHRGPDDEGFLDDQDVALGSCRLAILDLAGSRQPLEDASSGLALVFNGEIYNYREVREETTRLGKRPVSGGDGEAVLLAYAVWGEDYLDHLNGMFAFALFDTRRRIVRLARDRFG